MCPWQKNMPLIASWSSLSLGLHEGRYRQKLCTSTPRWREQPTCQLSSSFNVHLKELLLFKGNNFLHQISIFDRLLTFTQQSVKVMQHSSNSYPLIRQQTIQLKDWEVNKRVAVTQKQHKWSQTRELIQVSSSWTAYIRQHVSLSSHHIPDKLSHFPISPSNKSNLLLTPQLPPVGSQRTITYDSTVHWQGVMSTQQDEKL